MSPSPKYHGPEYHEIHLHGSKVRFKQITEEFAFITMIVNELEMDYRSNPSIYDTDYTPAKGSSMITTPSNAAAEWPD